jgi:hypothetical protein
MRDGVGRRGRQAEWHPVAASWRGRRPSSRASVRLLLAPREGPATLARAAAQIDAARAYNHGVSASQLSLCLYLPIEIPYEYLAGKLGTAVT